MSRQKSMLEFDEIKFKTYETGTEVIRKLILYEVGIYHPYGVRLTEPVLIDDITTLDGEPATVENMAEAKPHRPMWVIYKKSCKRQAIGIPKDREGRLAEKA